MTKSKNALTLYRQIILLLALLCFCVLALTGEAVAIGLMVFYAVRISNSLVWIGLFAFIFICVFTTDELIKYKMREYAEVKLDLRNMKLTDSLHNCSACGSIPRYIINPGNLARRAPPSVSIVCTSCGYRGDSYYNAAQAVHAWNECNVRR